MAGPFALMKSGEHHRVFVAVQRDRVEGTDEPIPESVTYELADGEVYSVTRMPLPVLPRGSAAFRGGVLWRCAHDALGAVVEANHAPARDPSVPARARRRFGPA